MPVFVAVLAVLGALLAVGILVLACRDQRELWWSFRARAYANPAANEPSDSRYQGQRVMFFLLAAFVAFGSFQIYLAGTSMAWSDGEVRAAADEAAEGLKAKGGDVLMDTIEGQGAFYTYVEDELRHTKAADENHVPLSVSRKDGEKTRDPFAGGHKGERIVEHYSVTAKDAGSVCLAVTAREDGEAGMAGAADPTYEYQLSAGVADGSC